MEDSKSLAEIIKEIETTSTEGYKFIENEMNKRLKTVLDNLQKLISIANDYRGKVESSKADWKRVRKEVEELEGRRDELKDREAEVAQKEVASKKEAENLASLHKVLDNRRIMLDGREEEIKVKERRLKGV